MQDFKHLSTKKHFPGFGDSKACRENRRLVAAEDSSAQPSTVQSSPCKSRKGVLLLFFSVVLLLTPLIVLACMYGPGLVAKTFSLWPQGTIRTAEAAKQPAVNPFDQAVLLLDAAMPSGSGLSARTGNGDTINYSIMPELQRTAHDFMAGYKVPYGVFVAIDPRTGRILAMTSYSSVDPSWSARAYYDTFPMASLFKIVTASAALENRRINPQTVVSFRGRAGSENPRYWEPSPKGRNNAMDVTCAMGKSVNPVYGKIAADVAGKTSLMECAGKFGFNQPLLPGTSLKESRVSDPADHRGLMLMGAGLDHDVRISPLHAASMIAAIANNGVMMVPRLADSVTSASGVVKGAQQPRELRRIVSSETAGALTRMLSTTVTTGTSRKAFRDRRGRPRLHVDVAAKTGSINGNDPKGYYSWFAAYAPAAKPEIAVVALVINHDKWRIKSSQVGEQALQVFFRK